MTWHSFELRPPGAPPLPPLLREQIEAGRPRFAAMARMQYGLEINQGPFGIDSRPALIGEQYARAHGAGLAYHAAVMAAYWQGAQRIDDPQLLADIAASVGLDRGDFLAALAAPEYARAVEADAAFAYQNGMTGVPALVFAERYLVVGAQPYPVLENVLRRCEAEGLGTGD